eukprot:scaffold104645_cov29-Tisochrysis_lutea.AAC.3
MIPFCDNRLSVCSDKHAADPRVGGGTEAASLSEMQRVQHPLLVPVSWRRSTQQRRENRRAAGESRCQPADEHRSLPPAGRRERPTRDGGRRVGGPQPRRYSYNFS